MIKLVLWDYTGVSSAWCENFLLPNVAQIVRTLKPDDSDQAEVIMRGDWDYVLIFTDNDSRAVFAEMLSTMRAMNFSTDKIIFVDNLEDWLNNPVALYSLLNPTKVEQLYRRLNYVNHRRWHRYAACSAEELHYVGTSQDEFIIPGMYLNNINDSADKMEVFHALAKKYYGTNNEGYFLDLGANIGTTGIYFCKKFAPNLKLFAVEPDAENFKLLRVNVILNDMESRATLVNCGLGEKFDTLPMYRYSTNPGANRFIQTEDINPTDKIKIAPIDAVLAENKIPPEEVKYIWIDTEGFESQVLLGAKNLLAKSGAPVFTECNLLAWKNSGTLERMVDMLAQFGYARFISVEEFLHTGEERIYPIENLLIAVNYVRPPLGQTGDIFLIKNV